MPAQTAAIVGPVTVVPAQPCFDVLRYRPAPDADTTDRTLAPVEPWFDALPVVAWLVNNSGACLPVTPDGTDWSSVPAWCWAARLPDGSVTGPAGACAPNASAWAMTAAQSDNAQRRQRLGRPLSPGRPPQ